MTHERNNYNRISYQGALDSSSITAEDKCIGCFFSEGFNTTGRSRTLCEFQCESEILLEGIQLKTLVLWVLKGKKKHFTPQVYLLYSP